MALSSSDQDLGKYLQLVIRRRYLFVSIFLVVMTGATVLNLFLPRQYQASSTVFVEKGVLSDLVKGLAIPANLDANVKVLRYTMKSRQIIMKVINDLKLKSPKLDALAKDFQDRTAVTVKDADGLFTISFRHENPNLAQNYVNTLIKRYIQEYLTIQGEETKGATVFLAEQINVYKSKFDLAEEEVNRFKREHGATLAETPAQLQLEIDRLLQSVEEIVIKRNQLEAMLTLARKSEDPLQLKLNELQRKLMELTSRFTDRYPEILALKEEVAQVKQQIRNGGSRIASGSNTSEEAKLLAEIRGLDEMERSYRQAITEKNVLQKELPDVMTALEELERSRTAQKNIYEQFVSRYQQSEISRKTEVQNRSVMFRVVDPAVMPTKPFSPKPEKILLLGLVIGFLAGFATVFALEYIDTSVRNLDTFSILGIPVLAVVQKIQAPEQKAAGKRRDICFFTAGGAYLLLLFAGFYPGLPAVIGLPH